MLDQATIDAVAKRLYDARKSRTAVRHVSREHPGMTIDDGYAIQRAWVKLELADGHRIRGRKIGLTSRAMQLSSQIDEPDFAPLMSDMFFAQGADIPIDRFIAPRVEVELAFVLGRELRGHGATGSGATIFDVLAATEYISPCASRSSTRASSSSTARPRRPRKVFDTISDFAANAGIVLGGRPVKPDAGRPALGGRGCSSRTAWSKRRGLSAGVLNHPADRRRVAREQDRAVRREARGGRRCAWRARSRRRGAVRGDTLHADYGPLGTVSFRFA